MPTQMITAAVPNSIGWNRIHIESSSSRTPLTIVHPEPGTFIAFISLPSPIALKLRNNNQKARKIGR